MRKQSQSLFTPLILWYILIASVFAFEMFNRGISLGEALQGVDHYVEETNS